MITEEQLDKILNDEEVIERMTEITQDFGAQFNSLMEKKLKKLKNLDEPSLMSIKIVFLNILISKSFTALFHTILAESGILPVNMERMLLHNLDFIKNMIIDDSKKIEQAIKNKQH